MLLTRRASDRLPFGGVDQYGMRSPALLDETRRSRHCASSLSVVPGIKHAAIRKCKHELGIENKKYLHWHTTNLLPDALSLLGCRHSLRRIHRWGDTGSRLHSILQVQDDVPVIPIPRKFRNINTCLWTNYDGGTWSIVVAWFQDYYG
jgi:hypothetical protein